MKGARVLNRTIRVPRGFKEPLTTLYKEIAPVTAKLGLNVYAVGGAVRDLMEGRRFSGEWDVVVFGGGDDGAGTLAGEVLKARGGGEPVSFPRFGTCLVPGEKYRIEFAQSNLRSSLKYLSSDPLTADALSRDFTLNALYLQLAGTKPPERLVILDPTGRGLKDLQEQRLKTPVPARQTFDDDLLRIFRAARFRACNAYRVDPSLGRAARDLAMRIPEISPERILGEMNQILLSRQPSSGLELLGRWNIFCEVMPEIQAMVGFRQNNPFHFPDLFRHTLRVVDRCPVDLPLRWAAMLHDCGKPETRVLTDGSESYHGHEAVGSELAVKLLKRLKAGRKLTKEVSDLVRLHMVHYQDEWSDRAVRRFIRRSGNYLEKLLVLVEADSASLRLRKNKVLELQKLRRRVGSVKAAMPSPRSPLTGKQIMEILDIGPGLFVGRAKEALIDAVVDGDIIATEDDARDFLLKWWQGDADRSS